MQYSSNILLIPPTAFRYNQETADSNAFQIQADLPISKIQTLAMKEFEKMLACIKKHQIGVWLFKDQSEGESGDAVFSNNWISFHHDGKIILYPMYAENRRLEVGKHQLKVLEKDFHIKQIIDLSSYTKDKLFLESTGSMVFDHENKKIYACISVRTSRVLVMMVAELLKYQPYCFHAFDANNKAIYHTNVLMCMGKNFTVLCLEAIPKEERAGLEASLKSTQHTIIDISSKQMKAFAGNMLVVKNAKKETIILMSSTAYACLDLAQKSKLEHYGTLVPITVPTIEKIGGGSVRCMITEIFLPLKK